VEAVHRFLAASYWAKGIPPETVQRSIENSLSFGLYRGEEQAGFARVITDKATFAYLCDVFVLEEFRGRGLGKWLIEAVSRHPDLQGLRRWVLATLDAHGLYQQFGFTPLGRPDRFMEIYTPNFYMREKE
jgi:GNAT superfamily N-acetyltransferase